MAGSKKHITDQKAFQRYLDDEMSPKERHEFEKNMLDNDFEKEAMEGIEQFDKADFSKDMGFLQGQIDAKIESKSTRIYWRIAATLLLLAIFSFSIFYFIDMNAPSNTARNAKPVVPEKSREKQSEAPKNTERPELETDNSTAFQKESEASKGSRESKKKKAIISENPSIVNDQVVIDDESAESVSASDLPVAMLDEEQNAADKPEELSTKEPRTVINSAPAEVASEAAGMKKETLSLKGMNAARSSDMKTITGKVMSQTDDEALPGVNVILKGTATGTITDIEGNYTIDIPVGDKPVLVYSSVGYVSEEVPVDDKNTIDVNIEPDVTALSEIVVTGYDARKKSDLTGAVSSISDDEENAYNFIPPLPVGGQKKFKEYIKDNLRYPVSGLEKQIKGTVKLKFTVSETGEVEGIEILKSLGKAFDDEAIRMIKEGPKWEPAHENDLAVTKEVTLKIRFRPPE